jgi:hypothetical protein
MSQGCVKETRIPTYFYLQALQQNVTTKLTTIDAVNSDSIAKELVRNIHSALKVPFNCTLALNRGRTHLSKNELPTFLV